MYSSILFRKCNKISAIITKKRIFWVRHFDLCVSASSSLLVLEDLRRRLGMTSLPSWIPTTMMKVMQEISPDRDLALTLRVGQDIILTKMSKPGEHRETFCCLLF